MYKSCVCVYFVRTEDCVPRLRKWIIPRLACIVENHQVKKDEELVTEIARYSHIDTHTHGIKKAALVYTMYIYVCVCV